MGAESKRRPSEEQAPIKQSIAGERVDAQILSDAGVGINGSNPAELTRADVERELQAHVDFLDVAPDRVRELRVLNYAGQDERASGYFDDPKKLVESVLGLPRGSHNVFVTLNHLPDVPDGRAHNTILKFPKRTTGDAEIAVRTKALIDIDPVRAEGGAATTAEKAAAVAMTDEVEEFLKAQGIEIAARIDSGNGCALDLNLDLPAKDDRLIERFLESLALRFNTTQAIVDPVVFNPARLCRLAATWNRKGDDTPERPHRRARLLYANKDAAIATREALEAVIGELPKSSHKKASKPAGAPSFDVPSFLAKNAIGVRSDSPWQTGHRWILSVCPFNPEHTNRTAYVIQFADGGVSAGCLNASCRGKGFREFNERLTHPAPSGAFGSNVSGGKGQKPEIWPDPQPLPGALTPVQAFDITLMPTTLRAWLSDAARRIGCPPEYIAVACIVVLGTVIGRRIGIRPKRHDDWLVIANLWGLIVGRPGGLKTPGLQEGMAALEALEKAAKGKHAKEMQKYRIQEIVASEAIKVAKKDVRDRLEAGEKPETFTVNMSLEDPVPPVRTRYKTNDATVEKLGEILSENPNGILTFRDELVGFMRTLDKEGHEGARAFYLEAWNGTGSYTYDRIGRGTVDIEAAIVSILGGVQPGPLSAYLEQALDGGFGDDGMLQRFQLAVYPDTSKEYVHVDEPPDKEARRRYFKLVETLVGLDPTAWGAEPKDSDPNTIPYLHFADDAQQEFDKWRTALEIRLRREDEVPALESHLAKYRSLVPSLALIFHLAEGKPGPVSLDALTLALRWAEFLEPHARRMYSQAINPDARAAQLLGAKVRAGELEDGFVLRDVYRKGWTGLTTREDAERAVDLLTDYDWLAAVETKTDGASKTQHWINPKVFKAAEKMAKPPELPLTELTEPPPTARDDASDEAWGEVQ